MMVDKKRSRTYVRLSKTEVVEYKALADAEGLSMSEYIRKAMTVYKTLQASQAVITDGGMTHQPSDQ